MDKKAPFVTINCILDYFVDQSCPLPHTPPPSPPTVPIMCTAVDHIHGMKRQICTKFAPSAKVAVAAIASSLHGCKSFANLETKIMDENARLCACTNER